MPSPKPSTKRAYKRSTVLWPLALIVSLVILKTAFEHHPAIRRLEDGTYQFMHRKLVREGIRERPDVLVIDISSKIPQKIQERDGRTERVTPREPLEKLIRVFADLGARSIGIDIDFSPEGGRWKDPGDPEFFDRCLQLRDEKGIPILLGVERTRTQPGKWLGDDRYMTLAAAIASPVGAHQQAVLWFSPDKAHAPLLSMGAGLAGYELSYTGEHSFWSWAVESITHVQRQPGLQSAEFTIDFASLDLIEYGALTVLTADEFADMKDKIHGRMILIGDTRPVAGDLFPITGLGEIPGVFLHACAAHTLARHPLYHLTLWGRIVLDIVTGALLFGMVQLSLWLAKRNHSHFVHAEHLLSYILAVLAIVIVSVVSLYWVHKTRLLWTDFLLFCAGLLAHPIVDSVVAGGRRLLAFRPKFFIQSAATSGLILVISLCTACEQKSERAVQASAPAEISEKSPVLPSNPTPAYNPAGRRNAVEVSEKGPPPRSRPTPAYTPAGRLALGSSLDEQPAAGTLATETSFTREHSLEPFRTTGQTSQAISLAPATAPTAGQTSQSIISLAPPVRSAGSPSAETIMSAPAVQPAAVARPPARPPRP